MDKTKTTAPSCATCGSLAPGQQRCAGCHEVSYCSKTCLTQDWETHKEQCMTIQDNAIDTPELVAQIKAYVDGNATSSGFASFCATVPHAQVQHLQKRLGRRVFHRLCIGKNNLGECPTQEYAGATCHVIEWIREQLGADTMALVGIEAEDGLHVATVMHHLGAKTKAKGRQLVAQHIVGYATTSPKKMGAGGATTQMRVTERQIYEAGNVVKDIRQPIVLLGAWLPIEGMASDWKEQLFANPRVVALINLAPHCRDDRARYQQRSDPTLILPICSTTVDGLPNDLWVHTNPTTRWRSPLEWPKQDPLVPVALLQERSDMEDHVAIVVAVLDMDPDRAKVLMEAAPECMVVLVKLMSKVQARQNKEGRDDMMLASLVEPLESLVQKLHSDLAVPKCMLLLHAIRKQFPTGDLFGSDDIEETTALTTHLGEQLHAALGKALGALGACIQEQLSAEIPRMASLITQFPVSRELVNYSLVQIEGFSRKKQNELKPFKDMLLWFRVAADLRDRVRTSAYKCLRDAYARLFDAPLPADVRALPALQPIWVLLRLVVAPLACATCGKHENTLTCERCRQVHYCSQTCQKTDWKAGHRASCLTPVAREGHFKCETG